MRFLSKRDISADVKDGKRGPEVIALGLSRCATSSLQMAFERLGFKPCMHMAELIAYADKARLLVEAESLLFPHNIESGRARRQEILHYLYDDYASASDFPAWLFAEDLMDMYPEAKIVLNQRKDPATWPTSIKRTLAFFGTSTYFYTCCLWTTDRLHYSMHQIVHALVPQMYGTNDLFSRELYDAHLDKVRRAAKERNKPILEWEATQGWQPICDFVGKPVPMNEPFPHANDEKEVKFMTRVLLTRGAVSWVGLLAAPLLAMWIQSRTGWTWQSIGNIKFW